MLRGIGLHSLRPILSVSLFYYCCCLFVRLFVARWRCFVAVYFLSSSGIILLEVPFDIYYIWDMLTGVMK